MAAAINKLSVSAILFGIIAGIVGIGAGLFLGLALGAALAAAFHVSTFEGEAGYFAVAIALIVTFIVTPSLDSPGALLARRQKHLAVHRAGSFASRSQRSQHLVSEFGTRLNPMF